MRLQTAWGMNAVLVLGRWSGQESQTCLCHVVSQLESVSEEYVFVAGVGSTRRDTPPNCQTSSSAARLPKWNVLNIFSAFMFAFVKSAGVPGGFQRQERLGQPTKPPPSLHYLCALAAICWGHKANRT